jgi:hypothetical protein
VQVTKQLLERCIQVWHEYNSIMQPYGDCAAVYFWAPWPPLAPNKAADSPLHKRTPHCYLLQSSLKGEVRSGLTAANAAAQAALQHPCWFETSGPHARSIIEAALTHDLPDVSAKKKTLSMA